MTAAISPGVGGLVTYLAVLIGGAPPGQLIELRYRRPTGGMGQRFFDVASPEAAAAAITVLGRHQDVYVAPAPRHIRAGTRDSVAQGWVLWADCDGNESLARLDAFRPPPAMLVRSGTDRNCQAYWPVRAPLGIPALESANRRLAAAVGADSACTHAAALARPPGSLNFKHDPPAPVTLERLSRDRFEIAGLLRELPQLSDPQPPRSLTRARSASEDRLLDVKPQVYVAALTGQEPGRGRKIRCPLHEDRTSSLHVYETAEAGWWCYGCSRGGSVYDLAGPVLGLSTRGREFIELRQRLHELLLSD